MMRYSILSALLGFSPGLGARAANNVESVRLEPVILNSAANCNRLLFRSSLHFQGTVFMMPQVILGKGPEGFHSYNITESNEPGKYKLNLNLYFPKNDEALRPPTSSDLHGDTNTCSTDYIMADLNRDQQDPAMKVSRIGSIPVRSIEVEINELNLTGKLGRAREQDGDVDILDYQSGFLTVTFDLNETQKLFFENRVRDAEGLPAVVKFKFQARSSAGAMKISLNANELQRNFEASAKGKIQLTEVEVGLALKTALSTLSMKIDSEAGSDEFNKMSDSIITAVLAEVGKQIETKSDLPSGKIGASAGLISVQAAAEIISRRTSQDIHFQQDGGPESVTAETQINLNATTMHDSHVVPLTLKAESPDPSTGIEMKAGQTITISALDWAINKINYDKVEHRYLTLSELRKYKLDGLFRAITDENIVIADKDVNGIPLAIGTKKMFFGVWNDNRVERFRWRMDSVVATSVQTDSGVFAQTQEVFAQLPLKLSFSALAGGQGKPFAEIFQENPYWSAQFDKSAGSVILQAKQDLGILQIHQNMHQKKDGPQNIEYVAPLVTKWATMEYWNPLLGTKKSAPRPIADSIYPRAEVLQRQIRLSLTSVDAAPLAPSPGTASVARPQGPSRP